MNDVASICVQTTLFDDEDVDAKSIAGYRMTEKIELKSHLVKNDHNNNSNKAKEILQGARGKESSSKENDELLGNLHVSAGTLLDPKLSKLAAVVDVCQGIDDDDGTPSKTCDPETKKRSRKSAGPSTRELANLLSSSAAAAAA